MAPLIPFEDHTPAIADSAWIAPNATVIGAVEVGAESSVFYGAVVRGDTDRIRIGERSNVQDNVAMHTDAGIELVVGDGVSVGHSAVLHGCVVEDDCLIGMNATVLNRAVIGRESLVAAGSLVREGAAIPPRSLVAGVPARVVRELTDEEVEHVRLNAANYVGYAKAHKAANAG